MTIAVLLIGFVAAVIVAGANNALDRYLAFVLTGVFIVLAASIAGGRDHGDYEIMIDLARAIPLNRPDLLLLGRIDPLFTLFVHAMNGVSDSDYLIFFFFAFFGFTTKLWLTSFVPGYRAMFMAGYALLLAPWLEFSAIRAAVALGLVGIAFVTRPYTSKIVAGAVASLAHISAVMPSALAIAATKVPSRLQAAMWMILACGVALAVSTVLQLLPRASTLLNNPGTVASLVIPIATCILSLRAYPRTSADGLRAGLDAQRMIFASSVIFGFSSGITLSFVTVAYRMLEMGFFLMVLAICMMLANGPSAAFRRTLYGTLGFAVALLIWMNYRSDIWLPLVHA